MIFWPLFCTQKAVATQPPGQYLGNPRGYVHATEARISFPRLQVATAETVFLITDLSLSLGTYAVLREREIWLLGTLGITGYVCLSLSLLPWAASISLCIPAGDK